MSVFVTGTDTDVGKTLVCAWLAQHWRAHYWKPIQSGPQLDRDTIASLAPAATIIPSRHCLSQPLSPHAAARHDKVTIHVSDFMAPAVSPLVVEGAGGVLVPLNDHHTMLDLMAHLGLPVLLVARSGLGTINHTLLSLMALRQRNLTVLGVVMNGPPHPDNAAAIEHFGQTTVLAQLPHFDAVTPSVLADFPCPIPCP